MRTGEQCVQIFPVTNRILPRDQIEFLERKDKIHQSEIGSLKQQHQTEIESLQWEVESLKRQAESLREQAESRQTLLNQAMLQISQLRNMPERRLHNESWAMAVAWPRQMTSTFEGTQLVSQRLRLLVEERPGMADRDMLSSRIVQQGIRRYIPVIGLRCVAAGTRSMLKPRKGQVVPCGLSQRQLVLPRQHGYRTMYPIPFMWSLGIELQGPTATIPQLLGRGEAPPFRFSSRITDEYSLP
jgi:hypothetical protein